MIPIKVTFLANSTQLIDHSAVEYKLNPKKSQMFLVFFPPTIVFNRFGFDFIYLYK